MKEDFIQAGVTQLARAGLARHQGWQDHRRQEPERRKPARARRQPILGCDVWEHSYYIDYATGVPTTQGVSRSPGNWEYVAELAK